VLRTAPCIYLWSIAGDEIDFAHLWSSWDACLCCGSPMPCLQQAVYDPCPAPGPMVSPGCCYWCLSWSIFVAACLICILLPAGDLAKQMAALTEQMGKLATSSKQTTTISSAHLSLPIGTISRVCILMSSRLCYDKPMGHVLMHTTWCVMLTLHEMLLQTVCR
jgi:hypothetical protein